MQTTYGSYGSYTGTPPYLPPRPSETKFTATPPSSPPRTSTSPRKVVSDFGTFSAPANVSVFGTAVQHSPFSLAGGKAAFGGMRNGNNASFGDDDDDEDDDTGLRSSFSSGKQKVELREDSISLDQVCTA